MSHKHTKPRNNTKHNDKRRFIKLHDAINSTDIMKNIDFRQVFDDAVQFRYGTTLPEYYEKSIDSIMVNSIRHNYSNYESNLKELRYRTENNYIQYKNSVLEKIANAYPALRDECNRQKSSFDMVIICN